MCEICDVQDETGLSDANAKRIIDAVQASANDHYQHTILSILHTLGTPNIKVTREAAERAAIDMDEDGVTLGEDMAADFTSITLSIVRPVKELEVRGDLRPLSPGEISEDNELAKLFKSLGLDF